MAELSLLGGQEGVQVDAELAAEAPDGADVEVYFLEGFGVASKLFPKSFGSSGDAFGTQRLLNGCFQIPGIFPSYLDLVDALPASSAMLL